jgi:anti-sigma factor RsiW
MDTQQMEEKIWGYIDGSSSKEEVAFVEQMIATDTVWRAKYSELKKINQLLKADMELEQPSMRFSMNVMDQLKALQPAPATKQYISKTIIRSIAAFFILTIIGFLIYGFTLIDWSSTSSAGNNYQLPSLSFDYKSLLSSTWINVLLMLNVVMGLLYLDNYLRRKKKAV